MDIHGFRRDLKKFDKRLDLVWNNRKSLWQVTGRDVRNLTYIIYEIPLGKVDAMLPKVLSELYSMSPIKQGGAEEVNRKIDRIIDQEEDDDAKRLRDTIDAATSEAHDSYMRRSGLRINNAGVPFTVTDKRRFTCQQET